MQRAVHRFMPGEKAEDALRESEAFVKRGASTIVTLLGENVETEVEAQRVVEHYLGLLDDVRRRGLDTEVSVKLTQLGLDLSPDLALDGVRALAAASQGDPPLTLWIDMEASAYVDRTLDLFRQVRKDYENVGVALQAYLHRTEADLEALLPLEPAIRLVKGAYLEPPEVAYAKKRSVDAAFQRLVRRMLRERKAGRMGRPAIATHDARILGEATRIARELELGREAFEFEMLYGIANDQQQHLLTQGYTLRVLISYGSAWFPWYMRRLAERPANVWFVLKQMAKK